MPRTIPTSTTKRPSPKKSKLKKGVNSIVAPDDFGAKLMARAGQLSDEFSLTPAKRKGPPPKGKPNVDLETLLSELERDREDRA